MKMRTANPNNKRIMLCNTIIPSPSDSLCLTYAHVIADCLKKAVNGPAGIRSRAGSSPLQRVLATRQFLTYAIGLLGGESMRALILVAACSVLTFAGVASAKQREADSPNTLTQGMVQMTLRVGVTTQTEVLETFGAPNLSTLDATGQEVWVYDRQATVTSSGSSGFSIGMLLGGAGSGVGGGGGLGFGSSKSKTTQTQRSMTLIIKFGADKRVSDFKSRSSSF